MTARVSPIIVIPARLASTRLPDKPLADICGEPMIVQVWRRAVEANISPVIVACADRVIADAIEAAGGETVMTDPAHPSGSDRVFEAVSVRDPAGQYDVILNLQGDLPTIDPATIIAALDPLDDAAVDIATLGVEIKEIRERDDPNVVKAVVSFPEGSRIGRALYFSRATVPAGEGPLYHHIGLYAWRRPALERFVGLAEGVLERRERLEQLRALEAGMRIDLALVDTVPDGVDTPADLERARAHIASGG